MASYSPSDTERTLLECAIDSLQPQSLCAILPQVPLSFAQRPPPFSLKKYTSDSGEFIVVIAIGHDEREFPPCVIDRTTALASFVPPAIWNELLFVCDWMLVTCFSEGVNTAAALAKHLLELRQQVRGPQIQREMRETLLQISSGVSEDEYRAKVALEMSRWTRELRIGFISFGGMPAAPLYELNLDAFMEIVALGDEVPKVYTVKCGFMPPAIAEGLLRTFTLTSSAAVNANLGGQVSVVHELQLRPYRRLMLVNSIGQIQLAQLLPIDIPKQQFCRHSWSEYASRVRLAVDRGHAEQARISMSCYAPSFSSLQVIVTGAFAAEIRVEGEGLRAVAAVYLHRRLRGALESAPIVCTCSLLDTDNKLATFSGSGCMLDLPTEVDLEVALLDRADTVVVRAPVEPIGYRTPRIQQVSELGASQVIDMIYVAFSINFAYDGQDEFNVRVLSMLDSLLDLVLFDHAVEYLYMLETDGDNHVQTSTTRRLLRQELAANLCCKANRVALWEESKQLLQLENGTLDSLPNVRREECLVCHRACSRNFQRVLHEAAQFLGTGADKRSEVLGRCKDELALRVNLIKHSLERSESIRVRKVNGPRTCHTWLLKPGGPFDNMIAALNMEALSVMKEGFIQLLDALHAAVYPITWAFVGKALLSIVIPFSLLNTEYEVKTISGWLAKVHQFGSMASTICNLGTIPHTEYGYERVASAASYGTFFEPGSGPFRRCTLTPDTLVEQPSFQYSGSLDALLSTIVQDPDAENELSEDRVPTSADIQAANNDVVWATIMKSARIGEAGKVAYGMMTRLFGPGWLDIFLTTIAFYIRVRQLAIVIQGVREELIRYPSTLGVVGVGQSGKSTFCKLAFGIDVPCGRMQNHRTLIPSSHLVTTRTNTQINVIDFPGSDDFGESGSYFVRGHGLGSVLVLICPWNRVRYEGAIKTIVALAKSSATFMLFVSMADLALENCADADEFKEDWRDLVAVVQNNARQLANDSLITVADKMKPACLCVPEECSIEPEELEEAGIWRWQEVKEWAVEKTQYAAHQAAGSNA